MDLAWLRSVLLIPCGNSPWTKNLVRGRRRAAGLASTSRGATKGIIHHDRSLDAESSSPRRRDPGFFSERLRVHQTVP
jgi:hypothetical protein